MKGTFSPLSHMQPELHVSGKILTRCCHILHMVNNLITSRPYLSVQPYVMAFRNIGIDRIAVVNNKLYSQCPGKIKHLDTEQMLNLLTQHTVFSSFSSSTVQHLITHKLLFSGVAQTHFRNDCNFSTSLKSLTECE